MRCPGCHHEVGDEVVFCPHCGRELKASAHRPGYIAPTGPVSVPKQQDRTTLSVVAIMVVAVVLLLPVLIAILYLATMGFGDSLDVPAVTLDNEAVLNGQTVTVTAITEETSWSDVGIWMFDGVSSATWSPSASALDGGGVRTADLGVVMLGSLPLTCTVTDLAGNGVVDEGDSFTLSTGASTILSPESDYTVALLWQPGAEIMGSVSFSG